MYAFGLKNSHEISSRLNWLWTEAFDVRALPPERVPRDRIPRMMQSLLEERFQLRASWQTGDQKTYVLRLLRSDKALASGLRPSKHDCAAFLAAGGVPHEPDAPRDDDGRMLCARSLRISGTTVAASVGGAPIADFVKHLEAWTDAPIVDETGLEGSYDAVIAFSHDNPALGSIFGRPVARQPEELPDIYRAVQEQLGLKLEAERRSAPVLVIEHADRPIPD